MPIDGKYRIGEVLGVERIRRYGVNVRTGEQAAPRSAHDKDVLLTSTAPFIAIPGLDEGQSYPIFAISSRLFTQKEFAQWLLARQGDYLSTAHIQSLTRLRDEATRNLS